MRPYTLICLLFFLIAACRPELNLPAGDPLTVSVPKQFDQLIPPEVLLDSGYRTMDSTCFNRFFGQWEAVQKRPVVREGDTAKAFQEVWSLFFALFRHPQTMLADFRSDGSLPVYGARFLKLESSLLCKIDLREIDSSIFLPNIGGEGVLYSLPEYEAAIRDFVRKADSQYFFTQSKPCNQIWRELGRMDLIRRYLPITSEGWMNYVCEYTPSITSVTLNAELTEAHIIWANHGNGFSGHGYAWKKNGKWEIRYIEPHPYVTSLPPIGSYQTGIR